MPINYQEREEAEYRRRASVMIQNFEGYIAGPYNAGDHMATIGFGYTFNRNNNLELWDRAGVQLSQAERQQLAAIDRAPDGQKTELGLRCGIQITREEARSLLENASLSRYESHATRLNMPFSDERASVVSITYNRGAGRMASHMQGFNDAIRDGDRAEAWYQIRYNSLGTAAGGSDNELGVRARRNMESQIFGLYDDPSNVTPEEARSVYRMFQLHREDILQNERNWGVDLDGNPATRNAIARADANYPDLVREYGHVQTLASALEPARNSLLEELRSENPELANRLRNQDFATTAIYLDPGRELRTGNLRQDQRNNTSQAVDENHAATIDSRRMRGNAEVGSNDLLIGGGGDDTLRSHRGDDILIGGRGRDRMEGGEGHDTYMVDAGDTLRDIDGRGEVHWDAAVLDGGERLEDGPANTYRSRDGRFTYTLEGNALSIVDGRMADQPGRAPVVIEDFQNGQLGITLTSRDIQVDGRPESPRDIPQAPLDRQAAPDDLAPPDRALLEQIRTGVRCQDEQAGRTYDACSERLSRSLLASCKDSRSQYPGQSNLSANEITRADHVVLGGDNMFVVQGALGDPASLRAHVNIAQAMSTPIEQSDAKVLAAHRAMGQEQARAQQSELSQSQDSPKPPALS